MEGKLEVTDRLPFVGKVRIVKRTQRTSVPEGMEKTR
jgi:hypothetical protein